MPVIKHQPIAVELPPIEKPADSVEAAASIAAAVAAGELTATEAAELAKVVDFYVGALATRAFEERLSKLENGISGAPAVPARGAARDDATVGGMPGGNPNVLPCRTPRARREDNP